MALDPVSGIAHLMATLRQQMGTQRLGSSTLLAPDSRTAGEISNFLNAGRPVEGRKEAKALEKKLRSRIGKLQNAATQPFEASVNAFIEGVLVAEFGEYLAQDPKFHAMLDEIVRLVLDDEGVTGQFAAYFSQVRNES